MAQHYLFSFPRWLLGSAPLHAFTVYGKSGMSTLAFLNEALNVPQIKPHGTALCQTDARQFPGAHLAANGYHAHSEEL